MPSSTSNSNHFILKSLVVCLALFISYSIAISLDTIPPADGASQGQKNLIRIQRVLADVSPQTSLILGSSMSMRLDEGEFPGQWFNFALAGSNALTGLEVLARRPERFQGVILIEANDTLLKGSDLDLVQMADRFQLASLVPAFRQEYQPLSVLKGLMSSPQRPSDDARDTVSPVLEKELTRLQDLYKKVPQVNEISRATSGLRKIVDSLQASGATVILFEPPQHPGILMTPRYRVLSKALHEALPPPRYTWLPAGDPGRFLTTDGVHLGERSARSYSRYLGLNLRKIAKR